MPMSFQGEVDKNSFDKKIFRRLAFGVFAACRLKRRAVFKRRVCFIRVEVALENQVELIFAALYPDNRRVLQVELRTGLRIGDVLRLKKEQIGRCFWVTEQKTGKRKQCGLPDWLSHEIISAAGESEWAFPSPSNPAKHRTRQAVWKDLNRVAAAFRFPVNLGTHSFRKSYAVDLMHKYGDIDTVRRALNHDNSNTTIVYALADFLLETAPSRRSVVRRKRSKSKSVDKKKDIAI